jgi:hypothetical protein
MADPSAYPELNDLLRELVSGVRAILVENLCGVYLQGSFALGGADEVSAAEEAALHKSERARVSNLLSRPPWRRSRRPSASTRPTSS